jgi:catechol 2,3-dioxygenase-like lactoylglutathione lyase family enzyme
MDQMAGGVMPNLNVSDLRPFIPSKDFQLSKQFYSGLGWNVTDVDVRLALVELSGQQFYIQDYYLKDVAENTMLHLTVEDAEAWFGHVSALLRDGRFAEARVQPPKPQPYGATVTFVHDPAGVLLHLCQWDR